jgi:hypothetical protein
MSDTRVVRWGILSTGRIAADFVSSSIHKVQQQPDQVQYLFKRTKNISKNHKY